VSVVLEVDPDVRAGLPAPLRRRLAGELRRMVAAAGKDLPPRSGVAPGARGARRRAAPSLAKRFEASFRLCGDPAIHALNRDYRGKDKPTDVLAFAMREGEGGHLHPELLGDVVISVDTARRQARRRGPAGLHAELLFLASHGLCHLLGYDHQTDAEEALMNQKMAELRAAATRALPPRSGVAKASRGARRRATPSLAKR
jgi:probable rRNA maturation factor